MEEMGRMMVSWGLPRTTGRVYAYLLLSEDPATLDQMAKDLEVAKSGASVATRQLVGFGMARTHRQRGSKRLGFDAIYDLKGVIEAREAQTKRFLQGLHDGASVASSPVVRRKMKDMNEALADLVGQVTAMAGKRARKGKRT